MIGSKAVLSFGTQPTTDDGTGPPPDPDSAEPLNYRDYMRVANGDQAMRPWHYWSLNWEPGVFGAEGDIGALDWGYHPGTGQIDVEFGSAIDRQTGKRWIDEFEVWSWPGGESTNGWVRTLPYPLDLAAYGPTGVMSWSGWICPSASDIGQRRTILTKDGADGFRLYSSTTGAIELYLGTNTYLLGGNLSEGKWTNVGFTYDAATNLTVLYIDGEQANFGSLGSPTDLGGPIYFGSAAGQTNQRWGGSMAHFAVFNRVCSAEEMADFYARGIESQRRTVILLGGDGESSVQKPNVYWDGTRWVMVYEAGFDSKTICWATAPTITGEWTRQGVLIGPGGLSSAGAGYARARDPFVLVHDDEVFVYFFYAPVAEDGISRSSGFLNCAHGPDIEHLDSVAALALADDLGADSIGRCVVAFDNDMTFNFMIEKISGGVSTVEHAIGLSPLSISAHASATAPDGAVIGMLKKMNQGTQGVPWSYWLHIGDTLEPAFISSGAANDLTSLGYFPSFRIDPVVYPEFNRVSDPCAVYENGFAYLIWSGQAAVGGSSQTSSIMAAKHPVLTEWADMLHDTRPDGVA